jgi:hypothetical protein
MLKYVVLEKFKRGWVPNWYIVSLAWIFFAAVFYNQKVSNLIIFVPVWLTIRKLSFGNTITNYLTFEKNSLTYGSSEYIIWHIPYENLSEIGRESFLEKGHLFNSKKNELYVYTKNKDKYSLPPDAFTEEQLAEIQIEIAKRNVS